ncbi:MAG: hypothetical protein HRU11_10040 [Parvularculaceae bacterium]|nr:hypothetical protein [Parvularculaceae bacterium]
MARAPRHHRLALLAAAFSFALQGLFGAWAMGTTGAHGSIGTFCAPSGVVSAEAAEAAALFASLTGDAGDGDHEGEHCPACTLAAINTQLGGSLPDARVRSADRHHVSHQLGFWQTAQGPPLGSRAPPLVL